MQYKLIKNSLNDPGNVLHTVLHNRGVNNVDKYIRLDSSCLLNYSLLNNMDTAISCINRHLEDKSHIHIVVDCDVDGYTSGAMMYSYLKKLSQTIELSFSLHTGKQHGLSEDIIIPQSAGLIIIPDASTSDIQQCHDLIKSGKEIIVLDHHHKEVKENVELTENPAIIINNQTSPHYLNKNLSAAGIVYKFLRALDDFYWVDFADYYLDLVALGNIGDMMDIKTFETKYLIKMGLSRIQNKLFKAFIKNQSDALRGKILINGIQFYIVPLINSLIRAGRSKEKELLFLALTEQDQYFDYRPRGKETCQESIYERVVRFCINAKARQNKQKEISVNKLYQYIKEHKLGENKILFVPVDGFLSRNLTGIVANKLAEEFCKPCLLLYKEIDNNKDTDSNVIFKGSARNTRNSPLESLQEFLHSLDVFIMLAGHDNAFGFSIEGKKIPVAIKKANDLLQHVKPPVNDVDFVLSQEEVDIAFILGLVELENYYGTGIEPAKIVIQNLLINRRFCTTKGKNKNIFSFKINGIEWIKFSSPENDPFIAWIKNDQEQEVVSLTVSGKGSLNAFAGKVTPQFIISEYEMNPGGGLVVQPSSCP